LKKLNYHPDIIHFHNIHGDYFDISLIKKWSKKAKLFFTLHDLWLFTGHCGVPLDCDRYKIGCGSCPDLSLSPSIPRDRTKENYYFKSNILKNIPINFIAPSHWVYNQIKNVEINFKSKIEVIKNAVDTNYFKSGNKNKIRSELGLPKDVIILLTCSVSFKQNPYKDIETLFKAYHRILECDKITTNRILLIVVGEKEENYVINGKNIYFANQIFNQHKLLTYFQSADLYIHSSHIETWSLTISEALSTGVPVIASDVGGISEQVKGYKYNSKDIINKYSIKEANGILFKRKNVDSLYQAMKWAINNKDAIHSLAINARAFAVNKLNMNDQLPNYLHYCSKILSN
jgi:glycosyltransferase involved in cell wall biosynthesis